MTSESDVTRAICLAEEKFGPLNVAVNCAGIGYVLTTYNAEQQEVHPLDQYERVLKVCVCTVLSLSRLVQL